MFFENEIRFALENRHKEVYMAPDMTPEKVTQIIGNHYKETLSQICLESFPSEVRVAVIMWIAFFVYSNNILLNIGVAGLSNFICDFAVKFKSSEIKNDKPVIHKYLKKWMKFAKDLKLGYKDEQLSPKVKVLIEKFLDEEYDSDDQMIIFVDQRLIADLLYEVLKENWELIKNKTNILDVVYSHSNRGILKKLWRKLKLVLKRWQRFLREL